jgi:hypothetical protein
METLPPAEFAAEAQFPALRKEMIVRLRRQAVVAGDASRQHSAEEAGTVRRQPISPFARVEILRGGDGPGETLEEIDD